METLYWLKLLFETKYLTSDTYISLKNDYEELRKMLFSTTKTMTNNK